LNLSVSKLTKYRLNNRDLMNNFSSSASLFSRRFSLNLGGRIVDLSTPVVMGIINATPDSFFQGSRLPDPPQAVEVARKMLDEGALILDVGAVSSRPGAEEIPVEEELNRLSPVVEAIRTEFPECAISVDTWRSPVARTMVQRHGIHMVNDISAGQQDPQMFSTMADLKIPYVMMHMQGTPEHMQDSPEYNHVVDDLLQFFGERVYKLRKLGVNDVAIDPGFGFGKTLEQNYQLLRELDAFAILELPVMVGISRKSMIFNVLENDPGQALNGTTAAHMAALLGGASILRVHDVKAAVETVKIFQQIVNNY
jgi:dihydropteroate synthase